MFTTDGLCSGLALLVSPVLLLHVWTVALGLTNDIKTRASSGERAFDLRLVFGLVLDMIFVFVFGLDSDWLVP